MAAGNAAPFALVGDQLGKRSRVASVEGIRRRLELVDHDRNHATGSLGSLERLRRRAHARSGLAGRPVELWLVLLQPVKLRAPPLGVAFSLFAREPLDVVGHCMDGRGDNLATGV